MLGLNKDVVKMLHLVKMDNQRNQATDLLDFLEGTNPAFLGLNKVTHINTVLVNIRKITKVKLVYFFGGEFIPIGAVVPPQDKNSNAPRR